MPMIAKNYNIFILGTVRNVEKTIIKDIENLKNFTKDFNKSYFYLAESDSDDRTIGILKKLKRENSNFSYATFGTLRNKYPLSSVRISLCRNYLVKWLKSQKNLKKSLALVVDLDGVNTKIDNTALLNSLHDLENWDAIFANQHPYYDIWALRASNWSDTDCWQEFARLKTQMNEKDALRIAVTSKQISLNTKEKYFPVKSAFGGLGVYKAEHYIKGEYSGIMNGHHVCEHVPFHKQLVKNGSRLFIRTDLMNTPPKEHIETTIKKIKNFLAKIWHLKK